MYIPAYFTADNSAIDDLLVNSGLADLVTATPKGLLSTPLPFIYDSEIGDHGALFGHMARANGQWQQPVLGEGLVIVHGPNAYVRPSWYAAKAEHGRVVPTWNYVIAHVYGRMIVHDDPVWTESLIRRLTDHHEADRSQPWDVDDAPKAFVTGQLGAIVGIELLVSRVDAKFKLSQNRSETDIAGIVEGLQAHGDTACAAAMLIHNRLPPGAGNQPDSPGDEPRS